MKCSGKACGKQCCQEAIWLDNNSVTPPLPVVRRRVADTVSRSRSCCSAVEEARDIVRTLFNQDGSVVFTSGGTENAFLISAGVRFTGRQKIVTSILDPMCMLMQPDIEILGIDDHAYVQAEELRQFLVDNDVAAVHLTLVNGEYGIVSPVAALARLVKAVDEDIFVYVDAAQACTRMRLDDIPGDVDAVGISSAKVGAYPGTGALWIRDPERLDSLMPGVRSQYGIRGGSLNEIGIVAMAAALSRSIKVIDMDFEQMSEMRGRLDEMLLNIEGLSLNFGDKALVCNTSNYSIQGVDSRMLCMVLRKQGLRVSESCSTISMTTMQTPLTTALGKEPFRNIRFSLSIQNTTKDIEEAYLKVKAAVEMFRSQIGN